MNLRGLKTASERRRSLEAYSKIDLQNIGSFSFNENVVSARNCENLIGAAQIPMGIAGPVKINKEDFYVPLATTEGALIASVNRGCKAINENGGASVFIKKTGVTRGPVFRAKNLTESFNFAKWLEDHVTDLKKVAVKTSAHIKLLKLEAEIVGRNIFVRFSFDTGDAMGMNMVTIATQKIADYIGEKTKIKCLSVSANYCVDKKPSWLNFTRGRGFKVWAEIVLTKKILKEVLKTTAQKFYDVWQAKCMIGSGLAGSLGFNAQFANIIAAVFLATGQDPAHVVEGSLGMTNAEIDGENLYVSIFLPDLLVGTVGGGTGLATQNEALKILGIAGGNNGKNAEKLAQIIGGVVLAGEISLLASLSAGSLAGAHEAKRKSKILK